MTSLLQGTRQDSPVDSKRVRPFSLPRLALGNLPVAVWTRCIALAVYLHLLRPWPEQALPNRLPAEILAPLVIVQEHRGAHHANPSR